MVVRGEHAKNCRDEGNVSAALASPPMNETFLPLRYLSDDPDRSRKRSGSAMTIVATSAVEGVSLTPTPTRKGRAASPKSGTVTKRDLRPGGSAESVWKKQVVGSTSCELTGMILARWRVAMSEEEKSVV